MVTIRKLAELAGVSHMAAWRALQNKPGVKPEVRARILALAEAQHYHPNRLAEGLFSGKTRTIGLIIEHVTWYFYSRLCDGVMSAALRDQVHVIILNAATGQGSPSPLPSLINHLIEQRVDGILISAGHDTLPARSVLEMWSHDIVPIVYCDTHSEKPLDQITIDERQLAQLAVDYLLRLGHQRIGYCGMTRQHLRNQEMTRAFQTRGLSLEYFIQEAGALTTANPECAQRYLDQFLHAPHPATAVICFEDHIAEQLLLHAQRRGLSVPGDLSILGCGNDILCYYLTPPLTSIENNPEALGARGYEMIQRRRQEDIDPGERVPESILIQPQLVIRESCGPPGLQIPERSTMEVTREVRPEIARLLPCCSSPRSMRALMTQLGLRNAEHFRLTYLLSALNAGYLERTIPDKPRSSRQQYRLTAKGQAWIQERVKGEG